MPWPRQACQFLIPHTTFIYTTNISKVSKGLRDVLLGYNLGFKSRIRPCKNYHSWGQFFWKNIGVGRFFEIVDKMSKIEKSWYHLISFDTLRKDTLHTQKTVLLHHLSCKVDLWSCHIHTFVLRNTHFQNVSISLNSFFL